jgi:diguanylate cyclase (GGDEF)-like protein
MNPSDLLTSAASLAGLAGGVLLCAGFERLGQREKATREQLAERERELRTSDLTGIYNRRGFLEHLERCATSGGTWSLLLCDLDKFKAINDTHGHHVGDLVLIEAAYRLAVGTTEVDGIAGHLSGDEFAMLLPYSATAAARLGLHIAVLVGQQMRLPSGVRIRVGMSVGVTPVDCTDTAELMRRADQAMYQHKRGRRSEPNTATGRSAYYVERRTVRGELPGAEPVDALVLPLAMVAGGVR